MINDKIDKGKVNKTAGDPRLLLSAQCIVENIKNPISGQEIQKKEMALTIVFVDMIVVVCFLIFIWIMEDS